MDSSLGIVLSKKTLKRISSLLGFALYDSAGDQKYREFFREIDNKRITIRVSNDDQLEFHLRISDNGDPSIQEIISARLGTCKKTYYSKEPDSEGIVWFVCFREDLQLAFGITSKGTVHIIPDGGNIPLRQELFFK